ncbi:MAG: motility quorum-sensing regulator / GCU-specific mRNA interferase toxin [Nitrospirae bacterium]|nr:MAG: motility quorum-sensing regulator / GCU-specific mRNA interferase toxin [Nitrospirota bacterium]
MEKRKPHYALTKFKKLFSDEKTRIITKTARRGAVPMGYMNEFDILEITDKLCSDHFVKSMTTYADSTVWQDVYKYKDEDNNLYIKLQLSADKKQAVLIQLKEDTGGNE